MLDPTKKKIPCIQGQRRSPDEMVGGAQLHLQVNLRSSRDTQRAQTKPLYMRTKWKDHRLPQETEPDLPLSVWMFPAEAWVRSDLPQGWGSGCSRFGRHSMWHQSSWRSLPLALVSHRASEQTTHKLENNLYQRSSCTVAKVLGPTTDFPTCGSGKGTENPQGIWQWRPEGFDYRTSTGLGKQNVGGHKKICAHQDPGKGAVAPQETDPDLPVSVQESLVEVWIDSGLLWGQGHDYNSPGSRAACWHKSFRRRSPLLPLPLVWPQAKLQGGNAAPPISRKLG